MAKGPRKPRAARARAAKDKGDTVKSGDTPAPAVPAEATPILDARREPAAAPLAGDAASLPDGSTGSAARLLAAGPVLSVGKSEALPTAGTAPTSGEVAGDAAAPGASKPAVPVPPRGQDEAELPAGLPRAISTRYAATVMSMAYINVKAMGAVQAGSASTLQLIERLIGARSLTEAVDLQTEHARKQFQVLSQQAKEFAALARRMVEDTPLPGRSHRGPGDGE